MRQEQKDKSNSFLRSLGFFPDSYSKVNKQSGEATATALKSLPATTNYQGSVLSWPKYGFHLNKVLTPGNEILLSSMDLYGSASWSK